jgi:hypothetical protein
MPDHHRRSRPHQVGIAHHLWSTYNIQMLAATGTIGDMHIDTRFPFLFSGILVLSAFPPRRQTERHAEFKHGAL